MEAGIQTPADSSQLFLSLYCGIIAIQTLAHFRDQLAFFRTEPLRIYTGKLWLLGLVAVPPVNESVFVFAGSAFILALTAAAANIALKPALAVALVSFLFYFPPILPLAYLKRKTNLIPVILAVALFAPDQLLAVVKLLIALVYLSSGVIKVRTAGFRWADGSSLHCYLIEHYLYSGRPLALYVAQRAFFCRVLSVLVLFWELSFWLVLVFPVVTWVYVAAGLLFHLSIYLTMRINYLTYFCPAYIVFFTPGIQKYLAGEPLAFLRAGINFP